MLIRDTSTASERDHLSAGAPLLVAAVVLAFADIGLSRSASLAMAPESVPFLLTAVCSCDPLCPSIVRLKPGFSGGPDDRGWTPSGFETKPGARCGSGRHTRATERALEQLRTTTRDDLLTARTVGRAGLPTTTLASCSTRPSTARATRGRRSRPPRSWPAPDRSFANRVAVPGSRPLARHDAARAATRSRGATHTVRVRRHRHRHDARDSGAAIAQPRHTCMSTSLMSNEPSITDGLGARNAHPWPRRVNASDVLAAEQFLRREQTSSPRGCVTRGSAC